MLLEGERPHAALLIVEKCWWLSDRSTVIMKGGAAANINTIITSLQQGYRKHGDVFPQLIPELFKGCIPEGVMTLTWQVHSVQPSTVHSSLSLYTMPLWMQIPLWMFIWFFSRVLSSDCGKRESGGEGGCSGWRMENFYFAKVPIQMNHWPTPLLRHYLTLAKQCKCNRQPNIFVYSHGSH